MAESGYWLSTTMMPPEFTRYAIVPPRAVKIPTLRRTGVNTGFNGGGVCCGVCASSLPPKAPAPIARADVVRKSLRVTVWSLMVLT